MGNTGELIDKVKLAHTSHISSEAGLNLALGVVTDYYGHRTCMLLAEAGVHEHW